METEKIIIKYLIENKKELTIRALANDIKKDYKIVNVATNRLIMKGILGKTNVGRSILISFNSKLTEEILVVEYQRRNEILRNKNLNIINDIIRENLDTVNYILLLFGSYSMKKQNKNSDIDLMFIVNDEGAKGEKYEKKIGDIIDLFPKKVHPIVLNENEFRNMMDSKEKNVVKEVINNNIILHGIEAYYELKNDK
ncbi:nucleotidyltransferase domain-containing protein [Candidatus Pacearchaeota archaeon]|nr:nucleotidyltransferase domain-containing protein [Candidatus Pacearchaeota archaeon]